MADIYPEMICFICNQALGYVEPKSGFRKCDHYFHQICLNDYIKETIDNDEVPHCPKCREPGNCVDTIIQNQNGEFCRTSRKSYDGCPEEDYISNNNCTVCQLNWNTEFILSCTNCQTSTHSYCLEPSIKVRPDTFWECKACWIKDFTTVDDVLRIDLPKHFGLFEFEKNDDWLTVREPEFLTGQVVAIIGSGPCGLAAAVQLHNRGHFVQVYEKNEKCGGLLREGFLTMKTSRMSVDQHLEKLRRCGIRFSCNEKIGDTEYENLLKNYDAVLICTGARIIHRSLPTNIDNTIGICSKGHFVRSSRPGDDQFKEWNPVGKRIIFITSDKRNENYLITRVLKGCKSLHVFEILPQPKKGQIIESEFSWPDWPCFIKKEKDTIVFTKTRKGMIREPTIKRILTSTNSDGNKVFNGIETIYVSRDQSDVNLDSSFVEIPETLRVIEADYCIVTEECMELSEFYQPDFNLNYDTSRNIITCDNFFIGIENAFAAGDCRLGQSVLSYAILDGIRAARQVHEFVQHFYDEDVMRSVHEEDKDEEFSV
ncbi:unnamed protein product [Caenorhabditis angaria]|uniref:RING-type domain-containing protein n=1 Tax=Caenorhabditis angaria TaxID=860376 RepID=A0A9P1NBE3_9PELO|nr:unnamed protein product [Caenorhabditis angaria]